MEKKVEPDNPDSTVDTVMRNIYACCDVENTGLVQVSVLIDYIRPFMPRNTADLLKLQKALDPDNTNREVTSKQFFGVMFEWTNKISEEAAGFAHDNSLLDVTPRDFFKMEPHFVSTPRSNVANYLVKGYVENLLNMSACSMQSANTDTVPGTNYCDKSFWEDEVNELRYQKRKTNEELVRVRQQLANTEEQNENLQADVEKLTRELNHVKELNEVFMAERTECDELKEVAENALKQADKLSKLLTQAQKEIGQLEANITDLELDKQKCEDRISKLHVKLDETRMALIESETKIDFKDEEYAQLEQLNADLIRELEKQKNLVDDIRDSNKCLTVEKQTMEKLLQKKIKSQTNKHLQRSESFSERPSRPRHKHDKPFVSAVSTDKFEFFDYDSPYARTKSKRTHSSPPTDKLEEEGSTPKQKDTPPHMYVINRSNPRSDLNISSNYNSDEDSLMMMKLGSPPANLQEEISEITGSVDSSALNSQLIQCQNRVLELQNELRLHENSEYLLNLKSMELENCKRQLSEIENKLEKLSLENDELKMDMAKKIELYESLKKTYDELKMMMDYKNEECLNKCNRLESSVSGLREQNEELKWKSKYQVEEITRKFETANTENLRNVQEIQDLSLKLKLEKVQTKLLTNKTLELENLNHENEDLKKEIERILKEKEENLKMMENSIEIKEALKVSEELVGGLQHEVDQLKRFSRSKEEEIAKLKMDFEKEMSRPHANKPKKSNFEKLQVKMDKKVEKLEEELKFSKEISHQKEITIEKLEKEISQLTDELKSINVYLRENRQNLKCSTYNFVKSWKVIFENISSCEEILQKINNQDELVESTCNKDIAQEIFNLKDEIEFNINIFDKLSEEDVVQLIENSLCPLPKSKIFHLKPPILYSRPSSPDSPSVDLEALTKTFASLEVEATSKKDQAPLKLPLPVSCPASPDSPSVHPDNLGNNFESFDQSLDVKELVSSRTSPTSNINPGIQSSSPISKTSPISKPSPDSVGVNIGSSRTSDISGISSGNVSIEENSLDDSENQQHKDSSYEDVPLCPKPSNLPIVKPKEVKISFKLLHYIVGNSGNVFGEIYMVVATMVFTFAIFCIGCICVWDKVRRAGNHPAGWLSLEELLSPILDRSFVGPLDQQM